MSNNKRGKKAPQRPKRKGPHKIAKEQNLIAPFSRRINFKFISDSFTLNNAGSAYAGKMYISNGIYDHDPALLSRGVPGYAENMKYYYYCQPLVASLKVEFANKESFPVRVGLVATVPQPDSLYSSSDNMLDLMGNPLNSGLLELSAAGGQDRGTRELFIPFGRLNGNTMEYRGNAQVYSNQPTSNPAYPMFVTIALVANSNLVNGVDVTYEIEWVTK